MTEEEIIRRYADTVYKIAYGYVKNKSDTDDIFQEVFLTYFKKERSFESEEHRKAWIIKVTINTSKDFLKSRSSNISLYEVDLASDTDNSVEEKDNIMWALKQLDDISRNIIYMFYYSDYSIKTIAGILDMKENTVKTKLSRAREKIKELLKKEE